MGKSPLRRQVLFPVIALALLLATAALMVCESEYRLAGVIVWFTFCATMAVVGIIRHFEYRQEAASACRGFSFLVDAQRKDDFTVDFSHRGRPVRFEMAPPRAVRARLSFGSFAVGSTEQSLYNMHGIARLSFELPQAVAWSLRAYSWPSRFDRAVRRLIPSAERVRLGSPPFDTRFAVAATAKEQAQRVLTAAVQGELMQLGTAVAFRVEGRHVVIARGLTEVPRPPELMTFYENAGRVFDLVEQTLGASEAHSARRDAVP
jgi:hypothetical protein